MAPFIKRAYCPGGIPGEEDPSYYMKKLKMAGEIVDKIFPDMPKYSPAWATLVAQVLYKNSVNSRFKMIREATGEVLPGTEDWPVIETDRVAALRAKLGLLDSQQND